MDSRTAEGEHNGFPWSITIYKSDVGTYTAKAELSCQMHNVTLYFPDHEQGKKGIPTLPCFAGSYLTKNPYSWIADFITGFIDGRNELVETLLAEGKKDEFKQLIASNDMQPRTNATDEQIAQMKAEVNKLVEFFGPAGLAHLVKIAEGVEKDITPQAVRKWNERGRIPATTAHHLCKLKPVKAAGFTREKLRPDVNSWVQVDFPVNEA